jgi:L-alanine-DL-glutamate epimerase-like enolase superfamily enzyme
MAKCDVEFVEQPVSAEDVRGLASVRKHSSIPVMADESVHSPADALRLIQAEAVDMINIKLMKSGGIHKARKIAEVAEAAGVPCMIGCMSESELGVTAAVHLAAAIRNIRYADLDSDLLLRDKLVKNTLKVENSVRPLSSLPGLGVKEIDQKRLGAPVGVYR